MQILHTCKNTSKYAQIGMEGGKLKNNPVKNKKEAPNAYYHGHVTKMRGGRVSTANPGSSRRPPQQPWKPI